MVPYSGVVLGQKKRSLGIGDIWILMTCFCGEKVISDFSEHGEDFICFYVPGSCKSKMNWCPIKSSIHA